MVMGVVFVVWGAAHLLQDLLPRDSRFVRVYSWLYLLVLVVSALAANWITKKLKDKYTFPRGGYVKFHEPTRSRLLLGGIAGGLTAAAVAVLIPLSFRNRSIADLFVLTFSVVMAIGFVFLSRRLGMRHYTGLSLLSVLLGTTLYLLRLEWNGMWWFFVGIGMAFTVVGSFRLRAFVRSVPIPGGNEP
jgi:hypothetical protein